MDSRMDWDLEQKAIEHEAVIALLECLNCQLENKLGGQIE